MIEIPEIQPKIQPEKKPSKAKIPFHLSDSLEADWIKQKIKSNKEYLSKCTSKSLYQKVEKDTLYLENEILPIIQAKTNLFFNELTKLFVNSLDEAIQNNCNAVVVYLPIKEDYEDKPKAGIANYKNQKPFTKSQIRADLYLYNRDGEMESPFEYVTLGVKKDIS